MTMMETEANNMCFVDARKRVDNATSYAKDARKKAEEALSVSFSWFPFLFRILAVDTRVLKG